ncbi:unnamed protein product [Sphagnum jensenii]|uniref:Fucosyltransferase n=1 Tax=Sphagnum jensenii TaxID=128206 RepID=A0ABP1AZ73_9BRYO
MKKRSPKISEQVPDWVQGSRPLRLIAVIIVFAIGLVLFNWVVQPSAQFVRNVKTSYDHLVPRELEVESVPDVDSLIRKIQEATRMALEGMSPQEEEEEQENNKEEDEQGGRQEDRATDVFGEEAREKWRQLNPCRSRSELPGLYSRRKFVRDVEPNVQWQRVLQEYEKLHRACIQKVGPGNLSEYFLTRSNTSGCKFAVGAIPPGAGLGNKVLSMASEFMYAVLTQRVFVVPTATEVPSIMCEPFEGSSWVVDPIGLFTPWQSHMKLWNTSQELYEEIDRARSGGESDDVLESWIYGVQTADPPSYTCHPGNRFFCDTEQAYLSQIPWLYFDGCIYFLPKLFSIPMYRMVLEELFPDRMALTHVLRAVMLPSDEVWSRIQQADHVFLKNADHRFGIQVRYREGRDQFWKHHNMVNKRVLECAVRNGILPGNMTGRIKPLPGGNPVCVKKQLQNESLNSEASSQASYEDLAYPKVNVTTIFITSLFQGLYDFMTEAFTRNPPATGEAIGLIQLTHDNTQTFSLEEDVQALTEIICLSLSDHLFVTPFSTFGGLAQGYGALTPWFIDIQKDSKSDCVRAQSMDTCYQLAANTFTCPYDVDLDGRSVFDVVPYIKNCLDVDVPNGLQLITANRTCV